MRSRYATRSASHSSIGGCLASSARAIAWPSSPAIASAHGSTMIGLSHLLARARYAHTISAVFEAVEVASISALPFELAAHDLRALGERAQLLARDRARQLLEPAVGGQGHPLRLDVREHLAH